MPKFRIQAEFDLEFEDIEVARAVARDTIHDLALSEIAQGGRVEGDTEATLQHDKVVATALVYRVLSQGAATVPFATFSHLRVVHEGP